MSEVIDLCAGGAGGFEYAARMLGLDPLGIELDDAACRVRAAAGFRTLQADISALDPLDFAPCVGLVGGVPCPSFSMAGKGVGRAAIPFFTEAIGRMGTGERIDTAELDANCGDATGHLVLEPLRWALALRPRWIAQEQVEPVLPLWEATAVVLREHGYWAWTGVVSSETFGTPQTRRRALLLASLDGPVSAPVATHARYVAPRRNGHGTGLFELPDPERITLPEDRGLLPWRSMAQALGWGMTGRPSVSVTAGNNRTGAPAPLDGGSGARLTLADARERGDWQLRANANACVRDVDEPAPTITAGHDSGERVWLRASFSDEGYSKATPRSADEPAATITGRHRSAEWVIRSGSDRDDRVFAGSETLKGGVVGAEHDDGLALVGAADGDNDVEAVDGECAAGLDGHAATVTSKCAGSKWVTERPATTVNGDPRISEPGHHDSEVSGSQQANAVRVSIEEAAALQGFPDGHPWMAAGSKTAAYKNVGNAIPPQIAYAALLAVGARANRQEEAA